MLRLWAFGLMLTGLTFVFSGCGGDEDKAPAGGVAAPGSPALPGAADAGIDVAKKKPGR
jgi:hypothetical protein